MLNRTYLTKKNTRVIIDSTIVMSPGSEDAKVSFFANFYLSGAAAAICKTIAAPIDRVKLLMLNQGEMLEQGRLDRGFPGLQDCIVRTYNEGITSFWRGKGSLHLKKTLFL